MGTKKSFITLLKKNRIRKSVINAFEGVNQGSVFDSLFKKKFYSEDIIPIGQGEMSDPPLSLAKMLHYLSPRKKWKVLEIGTGSGYSTVLLSSMVKEVFTIEYHEELAKFAKNRLEHLKIKNITFFAGEATGLDKPVGLFDAIIVFAACNKRPLTLLQNLKEKGVMVFPMGPMHQQQIPLLNNEIPDNDEELYKTYFYDFCIFPPIRGRYGIM